MAGCFSHCSYEKDVLCQDEPLRFRVWGLWGLGLGLGSHVSHKAPRNPPAWVVAAIKHRAKDGLGRLKISNYMDET